MTPKFSTGGGIALLALLVGCTNPGIGGAPVRRDLSAEIVPAEGNAPSEPEGECWAEDQLPAVIETATEQVVDKAEKRDAEGQITRPASYRSVSHQKIVQDRRDVRFRAPCANEMDAEFVATLQRALKARGYYRGVPTGRMDRATLDAVRAYQDRRGLASNKLSLAAAKEMGIVVTGLNEL